MILEWSPERGTKRFLQNSTPSDTAIVLRLPSGNRGLIAVETKYHEHLGDEVPRVAERRQRYREIAAASKAIRPGSVERLVGKPLQQVWQDHLPAE